MKDGFGALAFKTGLYGLDENTVSLLEAKVSGNELGKLLSRIEVLICRLGRSLFSSVLFWERF